jgi:uncharacterized membrane protein
MADIKMFRTISGEDIIAECIEENVYINAIQLVVVPSKKNHNEQSYGFAPFPQYSQPKSDAKITFTPSNIVFFIDVDEQFLEQYNSIYGNIMAPSPKIFLG